MSKSVQRQSLTAEANMAESDPYKAETSGGHNSRQWRDQSHSKPKRKENKPLYDKSASNDNESAGLDDVDGYKHVSQTQSRPVQMRKKHGQKSKQISQTDNVPSMRESYMINQKVMLPQLEGKDSRRHRQTKSVVIGDTPVYIDPQSSLETKPEMGNEAYDTCAYLFCTLLAIIVLCCFSYMGVILNALC